MDQTHFGQLDPTQHWGYGASTPVPGRNASPYPQHLANDPQYPAAPSPLPPMTRNPLSPLAHGSPYPAAYDSGYPAAHAQSPAPRSAGYPSPASDVWRGHEAPIAVDSPSAAAARRGSRPHGGDSPRYTSSARSATGRAPAYPSAPPNAPLTQKYLAKHDSATSRSRSVASSHRSRAPSQAPTQRSARSCTPAPAHGSALTPHRGSRAAGEHPPVPPLPKHGMPEPTVAIAYGGTKFWVYSESGSKGGGMQVDIKEGETVVRFKHGAEHKERKGRGDERSHHGDDRRRYYDDKEHSDGGKEYSDGGKGHYDGGKRRYDDERRHRDHDDRRRSEDGHQSRGRERWCSDCGQYHDREERCSERDRKIWSKRSRSTDRRSRK